jgi:hypothetical protein
MVESPTNCAGGIVELIFYMLIEYNQLQLIVVGFVARWAFSLKLMDLLIWSKEIQKF